MYIIYIYMCIIYFYMYINIYFYFILWPLYIVVQSFGRQHLHVRMCYDSFQGNGSKPEVKKRQAFFQFN